jgi:hypothetical protein
MGIFTKNSIVWIFMKWSHKVFPPLMGQSLMKALEKNQALNLSSNGSKKRRIACGFWKLQMVRHGSPTLPSGLKFVIVVFRILLVELYYLFCWRRRQLLLANLKMSQRMINRLLVDHLDKDHLHVHGAIRSSQLSQIAFIHLLATIICCNKLLDKIVSSCCRP